MAGINPAWVVMAALAGLAACSGESGPPAEMTRGEARQAAESPATQAWTIPASPGLIAQGGRLYAEHCARCHGANAEGAPGWQRRDASGMWPPPPLDGSGHAWHHDLETLKRVIREGSPDGRGNMPAWGGKLSEAEIEAVIAWFQSRWPEEIRQTWLQMNSGVQGN